MCSNKIRSLARSECFLLVFAFFLSSVLCQNAEPPRGSFGAKGSNLMRESAQPRDDSYEAEISHLRFNPAGWEVSREDGRNVDVAPASPSLSDSGAKTEVEPARFNEKSENRATSEVAERDAQSTRKSIFTAVFYRCNSARGSRKRMCVNESKLKKRRRYASGSSRNKPGDTGVSLSNKIRGSSSRGKRIQERGQSRSRNRGRKRNGKRTRQQDNGGRTRSRKNKSSRINGEPPAALHRAPNGNIRTSNVTAGLLDSTESTSNETLVRPGSHSVEHSRDDSARENLDADDMTFPRITEKPETPRKRHEDNVEHEFSKNLEKEIIWSRTERPTGEEKLLGIGGENENSTRQRGGSEITKSNFVAVGDTLVKERFDAAKMLGYSRSAEDLPIIDLENEVLARTLQDYNAYLKSGGKVTNTVRHASERSENEKSSQENEKDVPIPERPFDRKQLSEESDRRTEASVRLADFETAGPKGDLTCINGTFLPAPLARHALIKYVKSSIPGHEYLEADYECTPGFYMASSNSRLLCKNRRWVGELPNCKIRRGQTGPCAESSCDQVCNEVDGQAKCSCYKGFRLDSHKCIDIDECENGNGGCEDKCTNTPGAYRCDCPRGMQRGDDKFSCIDVNECLLNNGHGPCQDTCRNLEGSYECSCVGLPGTKLSPDNHTCQDAGPCAVNNAGCSHTCLSTMGRVFCLCPDGFMLADDWKTCQDVDECSVPDLQTEVCHYGCVNTPGSYRCVEPAELGDEPIEDSSSVTCFTGYELSIDSNCVDVNECAINNGGCGEICENTDGSFFCACNGDESAVSSDGKTCTDLNDVACPALDPARRGYLMCSRETAPRAWQGVPRAANRPGTKCYLKCPPGYQLHGEYELTCQGDGSWDGPKHGECVKYSKPRLECPKDVLAEIPPDRDEAFVTFDQPSTDLDWFRYVRSKPSWGTRLEASLTPGLHLVTFFARHPVSKKQASCVLRIIIKEGEAPKVNDCPNDIVGKNGTSFVWKEPTFTDNVKVTHVSKNESPGKSFGIGEWKIVYEASDEAGWTTRCVFSVVVHQD